MFPPLIPTESLEKRGYKVYEKIGKGSTSIVMKATHEATHGSKILALKIINKETAEEKFLSKFFPREVELLKSLRHPSIIEVHSILKSPSSVFIFMRYAEKGDLLKYITEFGGVAEDRSKIWFRQISRGIEYLHNELDHAHRDLKCENIFITANNNLKIGDFGFTRKCSNANGRVLMSKTYCGSQAYASPEIVSSTPYNMKLSDMWSLGVILFIMVNSTMPFEGPPIKLLKAQRNRNYAFRDTVAETISEDCKTVVRKLLEPEPEKRIDINELMAMRWLQLEN